MSCDYWIYREDGYTKVLVEEFGYYYNYTLIESWYVLEGCFENCSIDQDSNSFAISELERALIMEIVFRDMDNRFNIAFEKGLEAG